MVVYRPPSLSLDNFLTYYKFFNLQPCVYMSQAYPVAPLDSQIVQKPTTDSGSYIDHVYLNILTSDVIVDVSDTYYSDHDMVLVSLLHS